MLFDRLMKTLAVLLEFASEQKTSSQDILNSPLSSFLSQPSFENAEAIAKLYESTPLFNVHLDEDSPDSKAEENIVVSRTQMFLDVLERKIFKKISGNQHQLLEGKQSLFTANPKFIYGVSKNLFERYKKALKDKFGCDILQNFDIFYQFLNFNAICDILYDESQGMDIFSRLFKLVINVFDSILDENFDKAAVQVISSDFALFFDEFKEYIEYMAQQKPTLLWKSMKRILPLRIFSVFLFSYVDDTTVAARPLIFPCSRLYIFNDTNFSNKDKKRERYFSFKDEDVQKGYKSASVIIVSKPKDEKYSGLVPSIKLNNSEKYTICGVHIFCEKGIESYYPLEKRHPLKKWFKFNDEDTIRFNIAMLNRQLRNSSESVVYTIYEKLIPM